MHPPLFFDSGKSDKLEGAMDIFISWTLRCAQSDATANSLVNDYSKRILFLFLFDDMTANPNWKVMSVKTFKQWKYTDILADITLVDDDSKERKFALVIENKFYSKLTDHQITTYQNTVASNYPNHIAKTVVVAVDDCKYNVYQPVCERVNVPLYNVNQISKLLPKQTTGSELFDEFWYRFHK